MGCFAFCVDMGGLVHMKEKLEADGGGVNGMRWVLERGGGVSRRRAVHWLRAAKKTAYGFAA